MSVTLLEAVRRSVRLSEQALVNLTLWLTDPVFAEFVPEIETRVSSNDWDELDDAFRQHLPLGTGGIRGKLGPGPNRVNVRTIGEAAQGLCHFIHAHRDGRQDRRATVVVGHEARRNSRAFAEMCCEVFAANDIEALPFQGLRATPEVSFAVRHLAATAGVQITASHNPRTDNGFKFYWSHGGQVVPPDDLEFMRLVAEVRAIRRIPYTEGLARRLVSPLTPDVDEAYRARVLDLTQFDVRSAKLVFSAMHGAGKTNVLPVLTTAGFDVTPVREQIEPDENFPTAAGDLINPEYEEVMLLPMQLAERVGADLALCSDPDADRIGVAARISPGADVVGLLSGNQLGAALTQFLLEQRRRRGVLSPDDLVIETFVTTTLISDIARSFGIRIRSDLLVGFKWIAQVIEQFSDRSKFVFAAEESIGYLAGDFVRDKDAAIAALLVSELASWLKDEGKTIPQYLDELYQQHGYYMNLQRVVELPGKTGSEIMSRVMMGLRGAPPEHLAAHPVLARIDRLEEPLRKGVPYQLGTAADMLSFALSTDLKNRVTIRPSGTEPKLKYYVQCFAPVDHDLPRVKADVNARAKLISDAVLECSRVLLPSEYQSQWPDTQEVRMVGQL